MEDEDQNPGSQVAVALANLSSTYTTPEAQALAKRTFDELYNERGVYNTEEQAALRQLDATAREAKDALKAARDQLIAKRYNEQAKWFSLAGAFGQGSKSGRFGENLGRIGSVLAEDSTKKREFETGREAALLKNALDTGDVDLGLIKEKLAAIKARRDSDKSLMGESLKVLGREIRPRGAGTAGMSPFGKIAADEGFQPGTPAHNARVRELYDADMTQRRGAAGLDVEEENPQDTLILSQTYGVPVSPVDPFRGLSTKARQAAIQRSMDTGQRALNALSEEDATAQAAIRQIDRFVALNEKQASGPIYGIPGISYLTGFSNAAQEMDQIRADIARKQRQPGEGQVSNFDASQFLIASPGRGKTYTVNKNIGTGIKIAKQLQLEQSDFLRNYLAVNRHLMGAKEAWKKYLDANPIFDPKSKPGSFILNKDRLDYQTWFRSQMLPPAGDEAEGEVLGDAVDEELANMTPEQRRQALTPAYAKGGKVEGAKEALASISEHPDFVALKNQIADLLGKVNGVYNPPVAVRPPVPANSALQRIAAEKEALLSRITSNQAVSPVDTERMAQVNTVLDTVLQNASKNSDVNAGMRAEALWRQLQDLAAPYKPQAPVAKAEGGEVDEKEERQRRRLIEQMARQIAQGGLYNFSDEMLASLPGTESYDAKLRDERAALEEFSGDNPWGATGLQAAGAVPTGMLAGLAGHKALNAMRGSGPQFHPKLNARRGKAASVAALMDRVLPKSAIGKMMVSGGASGAVAGAGASQGNRGADAGQQAVVGSILGPLGGLVSKYGLGAARRSWDMLRGTTPRAADEKVLAALAKDTPDFENILNRMKTDQRAGVPSTIGDSGGKNTAALMEAVSGKSGRGPAELAEKLEKRQMAQGERIEGQVNRALKPSEYFSELDKLKDQLYTNAKPLYEAAYANAPPVKRAYLGFLDESKAGRQALKDAVELMNVRGIPIGKKDVLGKANKLSLQTLDYTKQALDDMITREEGKGANYVATSYGSALRSLRNKLRDALDRHSPEYREARAQYAGDLEVLDALRTGKEGFAKMTPKQVENAIANMSFAEKDAFRTGVAQTLFEAIGKAPRGSNVASRIVGNPALSEKLGHLFDTPKEAARFQEALMREFNLHKQSSGAIANATRQRAGSAAAGLDETPLANAADFALDAGQQAVFLPGIGQNTGGPWSTARLMQWIRNKMPMSEQTADEVADMVGVDDPKKAREVLDRLRAEGERLRKREGVSNAVRDAATRASAVATAPDPWAQMEDQ